MKIPFVDGVHSYFGLHDESDKMISFIFSSLIRDSQIERLDQIDVDYDKERLYQTINDQKRFYCNFMRS